MQWEEEVDVYRSHLEKSALDLTKREELRQAEIELMRQRERVASLRRGLPLGAAVQDYVFEEGPRRLGDGDSPVTNVKLSELFTAPDRALIRRSFNRSRICFIRVPIQSIVPTT